MKLSIRELVDNFCFICMFLYLERKKWGFILVLMIYFFFFKYGFVSNVCIFWWFLVVIKLDIYIKIMFIVSFWKEGKLLLIYFGFMSDK